MVEEKASRARLERSLVYAHDKMWDDAEELHTLDKHNFFRPKYMDCPICGPRTPELRDRKHPGCTWGMTLMMALESIHAQPRDTNRGTVMENM